MTNNDVVRVTIILQKDEKINLGIEAAQMDLGKSQLIRALVRAFLDGKIDLPAEYLRDMSELRQKV